MLKFNAKIVGISSGGKMEKFCNAKGIKHVKIKMPGLPRATLPYLLYVQLRIIRNLVGVIDGQVFDSIKDL